MSATDFQAGDRVSVEGVVTGRLDDDSGIVTVRMLKSGCEKDMWEPDLTLVERPQRKLRVGSVWEVSGSEPERYVVTGEDVFVCLDPFGRTWSREDLTFDTRPHRWREVPVEELEREAAR